MDATKRNLFVIGDVHGCWHTYIKLLQHWNPETELLIQVGDLVDRGLYSNRCLEKSKELEEGFPGRAVFLKGNHELMMIKYLIGEDLRNHWLVNGGKETLSSFANVESLAEEWVDWLGRRDLFWQNDAVFVSHAGISHTNDPFVEENRHGILWNRGLLRDLGKLQVIGHTPQINGRATFISDPPSWNVDTAAFRGVCLTGIKLDMAGALLEEINIPTDPRDIS
ncbi:metallophosphoesterase [Lunatimonas salinarum]|uniref:metallophosphoesterase n=1 Tax=Lunatimonas salinarum TaxID=1774590 RepID=UPI001ADFC24A|nr:metallophosphoesterase [Lunatimonas salinarum]